MDALIGLSTLAFLAAAYLLPWIIARGRQHHQSMAIGMLTLLTGWTGLGWTIALVWACTHIPPRAAAPVTQAPGQP